MPRPIRETERDKLIARKRAEFIKNNCGMWSEETFEKGKIYTYANENWVMNKRDDGLKPWDRLGSYENEHIFNAFRVFLRMPPDKRCVEAACIEYLNTISNGLQKVKQSDLERWNGYALSFFWNARARAYDKNYAALFLDKMEELEHKGPEAYQLRREFFKNEAWGKYIEFLELSKALADRAKDILSIPVLDKTEFTDDEGVHITINPHHGVKLSDAASLAKAAKDMYELAAQAEHMLSVRFPGEKGIVQAVDVRKLTDKQLEDAAQGKGIEKLIQ